MYGLIHKALRDFIRTDRGDTVWEQFAAATDVDASLFNGMQYYDDPVTYELIGQVSAFLSLDLADLLERLGQHWVLHTATENYEEIMTFGGSDLHTFLANLNALHVQVGMVFANLNQPSFEIASVSDTSILLEYRSVRDGLIPLVIGMLQGLGTRFDQPIEITHVKAKSVDDPCDLLNIALKG